MHTMGYHLWGAMLEYYLRHIAKASQYHTNIKDRFVDNTELFASRVRQLYHFVTDFNRVLL